MTAHRRRVVVVVWAMGLCSCATARLAGEVPVPLADGLKCPSSQIKRGETETLFPRIDEPWVGVWLGCGRAVRCEYEGVYRTTLVCQRVQSAPPPMPVESPRKPHPTRPLQGASGRGLITAAGRGSDAILERQRARSIELQRQLDDHPADEAAFAELLTIAEQLGTRAVAELAWRRFVAASGAADPQVRLGFARWLIAHDLAQAALDEAVKVPAAPPVAGRHSVLGQALRGVGRRDEARDELKRALEEDPDDAAAADALRQLEQ